MVGVVVNYILTSVLIYLTMDKLIEPFQTSHKQFLNRVFQNVRDDCSPFYTYYAKVILKQNFVVYFIFEAAVSKAQTSIVTGN